MSTLGYAILGLLADGPQTGYQVAKRMQAPIGYLWSASHSQIYPELAALQGAGLVRHRVVEGRGPRDNKRYTITVAGRKALTAWVDSPLDVPPTRSELLLRVRSLHLVSPERARDFIEDVRTDHEYRLAVYRAEEQQFDAEEVFVGDRAEVGAYAGLRWGIAYEEQLLQWCTWLLGQLVRSPSEGQR